MLLKYNLHLIFSKSNKLINVILLYKIKYAYNLMPYVVSITNELHFVFKIKHYYINILIWNNHFILQYMFIIKLFFLLAIQNKHKFFQLYSKNNTNKISFTKSPFVHKKSYNQYYITHCMSNVIFVGHFTKTLTRFTINLVKSKLNCLFNKLLCIHLTN